MLKKRGLFHGRKAEEEIYTVIIDLVLLAIVLVTLLFFIKDIAKNTYFEKAYLARDLALTADVMQTGHGETHYTYKNQQLSNFTADFKENKASIYTKQEDVHLTYPFYTNSLSKSQFSVFENKDTLFFTGCSGGFYIMPTDQKCPLNCQAVVPVDNRRLVIDPGHGGTDKGISAGSTTESALALDTAKYIQGYFNAKQSFQLVQLTRQDDTLQVSESSRIDMIKPGSSVGAADADSGIPASVVLSIHAGNAQPGSYITAFIPPGSVQSRSLACHIISNAISGIPSIKYSIKPSKDRLLIQNTDGAAVMLEIGDVSGQESVLTKDALDRALSKAIIAGTEEYYAQKNGQ
jgi:N-acetylmuramoyl-L-alanine amidase